MTPFLEALGRAAADAEAADASAALAAFVSWHAATHPQPSSILFATSMPERPRVDF
jgi:hypothetical protein